MSQSVHPYVCVSKSAMHGCCDRCVDVNVFVCMYK